MSTSTGPQPLPEPDRLLGALDAQREMGLPSKVLIRLARVGAFPCVKLGNRIFFLESDLMRAKREGIALRPEGNKPRSRKPY